VNIENIILTADITKVILIRINYFNLFLFTLHFSIIFSDDEFAEQYFSLIFSLLDVTQTFHPLLEKLLASLLLILSNSVSAGLNF